MKVEIVRGEKIPPYFGRERLPWHKMEVGDYFVYRKGIRLARAVSRAASQRYGGVFKAEPIEPGNGFDCRIWRVA